MQEPATPIMEAIIHFHNNIMFILVFIFVFVSYLLYQIKKRYSYSSYKFNLFKRKQRTIRFTHSTTLEIAWTIFPAIILMIIAVPSFALLYAMDDYCSPLSTVKITGHQWYWHYEHSDSYLNWTQDPERLGLLVGHFDKKKLEYWEGRAMETSLSFDAYPKNYSYVSKWQEKFGKESHMRLLDTDWRLVLPSKSHIRLLVTSADVLHSWAVPSFGVKVDACPGRLNQTNVFLKRRGFFHGQCSEICGTNHGFMPIMVKVDHPLDYIEALRTLNRNR